MIPLDSFDCELEVVASRRTHLAVWQAYIVAGLANTIVGIPEGVGGADEDEAAEDDDDMMEGNRRQSSRYQPSLS